MSWWADGASNQLVIGEKHIPQNRLGTSHYSDSATSEKLVYGADQTYLSTGNDLVGAARNIRANGGKLCKATDYTEDMIGSDYVSPNYPETPGTGGTYGFGSWHPGVCLFLLGDGAVKGFSLTADPQNVLIPLACVNDGKVVSLP